MEIAATTTGRSGLEAIQAQVGAVHHADQLIEALTK
jgi:hypothetical protein